MVRVFMKAITFLMAALGLYSAQCAPFSNLGFDEAITNNMTIIPPVYGFGLTSELLPGWQLYAGDTLQTNMLFNPNSEHAQAGLFNNVANPNFTVEGLYAMSFVLTPTQRDPFSLVQRG